MSYLNYFSISLHVKSLLLLDTWGFLQNRIYVYKSFSQVGNRHHISHIHLVASLLLLVYLFRCHCGIDSCLKIQALITFQINRIRRYLELDTIPCFFTKALQFPYTAIWKLFKGQFTDLQVNFILKPIYQSFSCYWRH